MRLEEEEEKEKNVKKKEKSGVLASRVVPNGVDATTAEWEGGANSFIYAGQGIRFCSPWKKKKEAFYYHRLATLFKPCCSVFRGKISFKQLLKCFAVR